jgi:uncharacterized protein YodC (DUF2158 family)
MNQNFSVGDEVYLKSSDLRMVIEHLEDGYVDCVWVDKNQKIERNRFPAAALKKAPSQEEMNKNYDALEPLAKRG